MIDYSTNHTFIDCYDWKGRLLDEPDGDEPELRRHCVRCGAFLPKRPQEHTRIIPAQWDCAYDEQGEVSEMIMLFPATREITDIWTCKRCGKEYESDEMYT